jgi:hypothetical protein
MKKIIFILFLSALILLPPAISGAASVGKNAGYIFLQVEAHGEAWYVNPPNAKAYYLGRPDDAFDIMKNLGLGISTKDLNQIPIGLMAQSAADMDKDGLVDLLESALGTNVAKTDTDNDGFLDKNEILNGYNPNGVGRFPALPLNQKLIERLKGRILLQVEHRGEAWYVSPDNGKRYFLGRPAHALEIMRAFGRGITDRDLANIPVGVIGDSKKGAKRRRRSWRLPGCAGSS